MIKKIILFFSIFIFIFINMAFAVEEASSDSTINKSVDIDISKIAKNFNKSSYVKALNKLGFSIKANQRSDKSLELVYDNATLIYKYNNSIYTATYPINNMELYKKFDVLSALLIDCISTMQGNPEGSQIAFALDDSFCYSMLHQDGIEKNYVTENGQTVARFEISPTTKFTIKSTDNPITREQFLLEYETLYEDKDCLVKSQDLIFYKTFSKDGLMELYIGNPKALNDFSYNSILTAISILFEDQRASYYIARDYSNFSVGNFELEGVSIDTNVNKLPVNNVDTVLVPNDMKYAKITIDRDVLKSKLDSVEIPQIEQSQNSNNSDKNFFIYLSFAILILVVVIFIIIKRHKKSNNY